MIYFLEHIARSLHAEFGNTLNRHCLVFPNRRAGLYFMKYLASGLEKPVWAPATYTINELFRLYSPYQAASGEVLLFELYKVYRKLKKSPESFDDFYFWGDMLLDDFDDVDKYMADTVQLFRNVLDIKTIDQLFGGLTEYQIEIIRRFWVNFNPEKLTREKSGFIDIWSVLHDIYTEFRESLRKQNLAYEGMIFRDLAENSDIDFYSGPGWDMVHFIGFNALNECEKSLMRKFRKGGKARFYWDYDNSYIKEGQLNSAGFFMRDNLRIFGNDMPAGWNYNTMLSTGLPAAKRRVIETSSDVAQVKLIPELIRQLHGLTEENAHHTAVVLADENLLMPVLTSLPENIGDINITMGYPLKHTLVYTLIRHLMALQRNSSGSGATARFGYREVLSILKHPLVGELLGPQENLIVQEITDRNLIWIQAERFASSENLKLIFEKPATSSGLSDYFKNLLSVIASANDKEPAGTGVRSMSQNIRNEFIYRIILSVNRLESIISKGDISFSAETYMRILDRMLRIQSVPFSGEPLSGIQIMGILETRTLDFRNLVILSVNEGTLPSVSGGSSFIPFSLREAFGLPSINHQESIYAYHFYRLLQRAENVTFLYNSNSDGLRTGEMSRFLVQMKYDPLLKPEFQDLSFEIKSHGSIPDRVERTEEHTAQLLKRFSGGSSKGYLSPSAINTWLNCRMKFYYRYVNGLREPAEVTKDIDPAMLGEILHDVMRNLYAGYNGKTVSAGDLIRILENRPMIEQIILDSINDKFSNDTARSVEGTEFIIRDVLTAYVMKILRADIAVAPFSILHLESEFRFPLRVQTGNTVTEVITGGKADRIDMVNGTIRIVDYKTGTVSDKIGSVEELFEDDRKKDSDAWLQTLLYCEAYIMNNTAAAIRPSVYKIRKMSSAAESDKLRIRIDSKNDLPVDDYQTLREQFMIQLRKLTDTIFSSDEPFVMTADIRGKCSWCPYRELCIR